MENLGIQVYSVRDFMKTEERMKYTFEQLKNYGYTEIQTAGCQISEEKYAALAHGAGLKIVGTHSRWEQFDNIDEIVRIHQVLGTTNAGIGGIGAQSIFGEKNPLAALTEFIAKANRVAAELGKHGMKFTYHHHGWEFAGIDGKKRVIDLLLENFDPTNTSFVFDTYWLQHAGAPVNEWIEQYGNRVDILHLKDKSVPAGKYDGVITELGSGNLDFASIIKVAKKAGIKHFCYEQDYGWAVDPLVSAEESAEYLKALL